MTWEQVKEICFGSLKVDPDRFYNMKVKDLWTMLAGWDNEVMFNLGVQRKMTAILAETINRSLGGKGAIDFVMGAFELPTDQKESAINQLTPSQISEILRTRKEARERKQKQIENN